MEDLQKRYRDSLVKLDSQVSQLLRFAGDYQEFYDRVCAGTMELVDADLSALPLIDESGKTLTCVAARASKIELLSGQTVLIQEGGLRAWVAIHGEPLRVSNLASDPRVVPELAQELDAFAHSVSHDLRSPLLTIEGFSKALLEDYNSALDDTGRDYLNRVRTTTQRMGRLIDDLLGLSRVSRSEGPPMRV